MRAKRNNKGKPHHFLIDKDFLDELSYALMEGEETYGANNWKNGLPWGEIWSAAMRHLLKAKDVEKYDKDSKHYKTRHLAHAAANIMMLIWQENHHPNPDMRNPVE